MMRIQSLLGMVFVLSCILPRAGAQPPAAKTSSEVYGNRPNMQLKAETPQRHITTTVGHARVSDSTQSSIHIAVMGQVRKPGVFEFQDGIPDLEELVSLAGGLTRYAAREFYVLSNSRPLTQLEPSRHLHFPFEHGDVLLVETPARYYERLGQPAPGDVTLAEIHPVTQLALLDVIDRPILLQVPADRARLTGLLALLNQTPNAAAGVRVLEPPHANRIPSSAKLAPGLLPSGAVVVFAPSAVDRGALPEMPASHRVPRVDQVLPVAHETRSAPMLSRESDVLVNPPAQREMVKSVNPPPAAENSGFVPLDPINRTLESTAPGVKHQLARELAQSTTDNESDALPSAFEAPPVPEERVSILTSRQRGYILGFLGLVTLLGTVLWVRHRGTRGFSTGGLAAAGSGAHGTSQPATYAHPPAGPRNSKRGHAPRTTSPSETAVPMPDTPMETCVAPPVEHSRVQGPAAVSSAPAFPPVPETIMDRLLLEELIEGGIDVEPEPLREERIEIVSKDDEAPAAPTPSPPVATSTPAFRVDAPHNSIPQPLFPIIWNTPSERRHEPAEIRRFVPDSEADSETTSVPASETLPTGLAPSSSESENPLSTHAAPACERRTPPGGTSRSLLDRALLAARRERGK